jgi:hypothetical protein
MNMNKAAHTLIIGLWLTSVTAPRSAAFTNLNFESAELPFVPRGEFGTWQPIRQAIPGWQLFLGQTPYDYVLHNNASLGDASVSVYGPDWGATILEERYSVVLRPGVNGLTGEPLDVSLVQHGRVPMEAASLLFLGVTSRIVPTTQSRFGVYANDQLLEVQAVNVGTNFTTYAANIAGFAGQLIDLRFTAYNIPRVPNALVLDAILFVPEPSSWALLGLGAVALGYRIFRQWRRAG